MWVHYVATDGIVWRYLGLGKPRCILSGSFIVGGKTGVARTEPRTIRLYIGSFSPGNGFNLVAESLPPSQ